MRRTLPPTPLLLTALLLAALLSACGGPPNPLDELRAEYAEYPQYSVVLEDMRDTGTFGHAYEHLYRVLLTEEVPGTDEVRVVERTTDWRPVGADLYRRYEDMLGLVVLSKKDGEVSTDAFPPALAYVGDPRYGEWSTGDDGNEFWQFYAGFVVLDALDDVFDNRRIRRSVYRDYRTTRSAGRPYTAGGRFGTRGTATRTTNPSFFQRQAARQTRSRSSFSDRVSNRVGRSTGSGFRSSGGGFGK